MGWGCGWSMGRHQPGSLTLSRPFCLLVSVHLALLTLVDFLAPALKLDPTRHSSLICLVLFPHLLQRPGGLLLTCGLMGPDTYLLPPGVVTGCPNTAIHQTVLCLVLTQWGAVHNATLFPQSLLKSKVVPHLCSQSCHVPDFPHHSQIFIDSLIFKY